MAVVLASITGEGREEHGQQRGGQEEGQERLNIREAGDAAEDFGQDWFHGLSFWFDGYELCHGAAENWYNKESRTHHDGYACTLLC